MRRSVSRMIRHARSSSTTRTTAPFTSAGTAPSCFAVNAVEPGRGRNCMGRLSVSHQAWRSQLAIRAGTFWEQVSGHFVLLTLLNLLSGVLPLWAIWILTVLMALALAVLGHRLWNSPR